MSVKTLEDLKNDLRKAYTNAIRDTDYWAGFTEQHALNKLYGVEIHTLELRRGDVREGKTYEMKDLTDISSEGSKKTANKKVYVAYRRNSHYSEVELLKPNKRELQEKFDGKSGGFVKVIKTPPDGSCLFHAVKAVSKIKDTMKQMRKKTAKWLFDNLPDNDIKLDTMRSSDPAIREIVRKIQQMEKTSPSSTESSPEVVITRVTHTNPASSPAMRRRNSASVRYETVEMVAATRVRNAWTCAAQIARNAAEERCRSPPVSSIENGVSETLPSMIWPRRTPVSGVTRTAYT